MSRKKEKKSTAKVPPPHNPADEGYDHSIRTGTEEDYNSSYIDKQSASGNRGEENEESTDAEKEEK